VLVVTGYLEMRLQDHLQDDLRDSYGASAAIACEQIAAIRTVASLRRENALHAEFVASLDAPVRQAMLSTTKSTIVCRLKYLLIIVLCFQSECPTLYQRIVVLVW
jgi:hypothetical protein